MKRLFCATAIIIFLFVFSCKENKILSLDKKVSEIEVDISGLQNLGTGYWYEMWVIWFETDPKTLEPIEVQKSIGLFTVDDGGVLSSSVYDVNMGYLQKGVALVITIEDDDVPGMYFNVKTITADSSVTDTLEEPSRYRIFTGKLTANDGYFSIGDEYLLNHDLMAATGFYMLSTPTDSNNTAPKRGLWFVSKDTNDTFIQGLDLPDLTSAELPTGWTYEGWVNYNGNILSTGRFKNPAIKDESSIYSDTTGAAFPFPGEDFIYPDTVTTVLPADLSGLEIGVSIIPPYPAEANAPYTLNQFTTTIPADAAAEQVYEIENNTHTFPSGQLRVNIKIYD
jgi:hypothetical protein